MEDNVAQSPSPVVVAAEAIPASAAGPSQSSSTSASVTSASSSSAESPSAPPDPPHPPRSHRVHTRPSPLFTAATTTTTSRSSSALPSTPPPPSLPVRSPLRPPARSISNQSSSSSAVSTPPHTPHSTSDLVSGTNTTTTTTTTPESDTPVDIDADDDSDPTLTLKMTHMPPLPLPATPALRIQMRDRDRDIQRERDMRRDTDRDRDRHNSFPSLNGLIDPLLATIDSFSVDLLAGDNEREWEKERSREKGREREKEKRRERETEFEKEFEKEKELPERPETPLSVDLEAELLDDPDGNNNNESEHEHEHKHEHEHEHDNDLLAESTFTSSTSTYTSRSTDRSFSSPSTGSSARSSAPTSITSSVISAMSLSSSQRQQQARPQKHEQEGPAGPKTTQTMSKRHHAMHELLSSERAYASDLALIREVHIPLALGQTPMLQNISLTPPPSGSSSASASNPNSGSSSTRTLSTSSDSSTASLGPPMTPEDVKVIFSNIEELALLSDAFSDRLETALGNVLEGGEGEDWIGMLFLECVPMWERPYKQYITRHPSALQHLQNLPQTPALAAYLAYTQRVASSLSHAWDLASLLIKPVQRLLKYPLLLHTIIDETPDGHPDKENLRAAKERIEELARNVNEGRRRAEVVKDVLTSKGVKKPSAPVGVSAGVSLSKVKSLRHGGVTAATMRVNNELVGNGNGGGEAALVESMQAELKQIEVFAQQFARNVVDWGKMMSNVMLALRTWALSFSKVIGLSLDPNAETGQRSEAFDAFLGVIREKLMPLSADLEAAINERLLKDLAHLLGTMTQPLKLLASMSEQEPYHYHLLTMPLSPKNRPPASLLAASTNYLALRGQLAAELPTYLQLLHRGFSVLIRRLAELQTRFWRDVKEHWAELWEMLRVESELNVGWEETCAVWCARWADVDEVVKALAVTGPVPHLQPTPRTYFYTYQLPPASSSTVASPAPQQTEFAEYFAYPNFYMPMSPPPPPPVAAPSTPKDRRESGNNGNSNSKLEKHNSKSSGHSSKSSGNKDNNAAAAAATVQSMFAALEPAHSPVHHKKSTISSSSFSSSAATAGASSSTMNVNSGAGAGYAPSMVTGSLFGGGASMYSVSGPLPLGSVPVPRDRDRDRESGRKDKDKERERDRGRGRGASDASKTSYGGSGSGRRPGSQDRQQQQQQQQQYQQYTRSPPPPLPQSPPVSARRRTQGHAALADEFAEYVAQREHTHAQPPPYDGAREHPYSPTGQGGGETSPRQGITRMKSMPVNLNANANGHGHGYGYVVEGERERDREKERERERMYRQEEWEAYDAEAYHPQQQQQQQRYQEPQPRQGERGRDRDKDLERERERERETESSRRLTKPHRTSDASPKRRSKEQSHSRKRSGSVKSITAFFTSSNPNINNTSSSSPNSNSNSNSSSTPAAASADPQPLTPSQRDSWASKPAKYICQVIHACKPPPSISYYSFPFFTLREGELYEVLQEAGHPSIHPKLPLYVDDGEDCLLLCRDGRGVVGWALASFLEPVSIGG